jgi:Fic family protein
MKADDFKNSPSGRLVPTIQNSVAFVPNPLPPRIIDLGKLAVPLAKATHALGELSGIGRALPNPHLLIRPFSRVEAIASSKIEGTVTTLPELLILEASAETGAEKAKARGDTREVRNYTRALEYGLQRITTLPLSKRLIREIHAVLLDEVRGTGFVPGEFKTDQNWIGARLIQNARFVPPPPKEAFEALDDLEKYIHSEQDELPILIKLALIHYQFEAIHPFPDGNGRVGRLIIPLILCEKHALSQPLLYLSAFFENNYDRYIDLMYDVSRLGLWESWIEFFLEGIEFSSKSAIKRSHALQDLHREYFRRIQAARSSALLGKLVDTLFNVPAITIPYAMAEMQITYNAAKNNLQRLVELGIVRPRVNPITGARPQWFFAEEIMEAVAAKDEP